VSTLTEDDIAELLIEARLDERDEISSYLRQVAAFTLMESKKVRWWKRGFVQAGAIALARAADIVSLRHRSKML
jgi:hypothetical protein